MFQRHVYLKLKEQCATDADRQTIRSAAQKVIPSVPGVVGIRVATPCDDASAKAWDIALIISFDKAEAIAPYIVHPDHKRYVEEVLNPRVEVKKAWNFDVA